MNCLGKIFSGLGVFLLLIAGFIYFREASFLQRAETATGSIVDFKRKLSVDDNGHTYCPIIEFTTKTGETVRYTANVCSDPPAYTVGQKVNVIYDPANTTNVKMDNFWSKYVGSFVFAVIGLPFLLVGLFMGFARGKKS